jgi:hypothetical protein
MKMMEGAFFSASTNTLRRLDSDSPASLLMISGPGRGGGQASAGGKAKNKGEGAAGGSVGCGTEVGVEVDG